ncbi:hypothetical protein QQS21_000509 [Conoideocrella luteorostrata]|uniref:Short-chain dehydrogenase/reductase 3 n=1 Tax=Conoideocrella luteorostrata TaxID=1105319 RepID=A0AAJ0D0W3_9HYPO|nr:hypothetical protein QQS21_000509 [Conoideocrella luteorostrata]
MSLVKVIESAPVRGLQSLSAAVQSPLFSGPLLAALMYAPDELKQEAFKHLPGGFNVELAQKALQVLLGIGLVKTINQGFSAMAANSWRASAAKGWDWPREIAVVTGGCSGIGYCIVKRLAARKVKVVIMDIQEAPKDFANNPLIRYYKCDVTSPESVAKAADAIRRDVGHPSILINNAGITRPMPILEMPQEFLQKIFAVNTMCHWTMVQQFLPHMIKVNKGHVMTVASMASFVALPKGADYSATKAAALSFHESLAIELKHVYKADSVLTSVAHPNFVRTPLVKDFGHHLEAGGVRMLTPDGVAGAITDQIFRKRGAQLIIPPQQATVTGIRGWPTWLQVLVRDQLGYNASKIGA